MSHEAVNYLLLQVGAEYLFIGFFMCALCGVHKWEIPYAIVWVLILWPAWLAVGVYRLYCDVFKLGDIDEN